MNTHIMTKKIKYAFFFRTVSMPNIFHETTVRSRYISRSLQVQSRHFDLLVAISCLQSASYLLFRV